MYFHLKYFNLLVLLMIVVRRTRRKTNFQTSRSDSLCSKQDKDKNQVALTCPWDHSDQTVLVS